MRREIKLEHKSHTGHKMYSIGIEHESGEQEKYFLDEHPEGLYITGMDSGGLLHTVFVSHEAMTLITAVAEHVKIYARGRREGYAAGLAAAELVAAQEVVDVYGSSLRGRKR